MDAIQRLGQRVRHALGVAEAEEELARLAPFGDLVPETQAWHAVSTAALAPWYLIIRNRVSVQTARRLPADDYGRPCTDRFHCEVG